MATSDKLPDEKPDPAMEVPALDWNKCNVCGERFPNWPKLRDHKRQHRPPGVDGREWPRKDEGRSK
jgi:hypothetical protein